MNTGSLFMHCNAGTDYGMGHLMRCLTLAQEAESQGWSVTLAGDLDDVARERIATMAPGIDAHQVARGHLRENLPNLVATLAADVVHIDSYWSESDALSGSVQIVSNMQDGPFGVRPAALAIDANLGAEHWFAEPELSTHQLAGASVTAVRQQVLDTRGSWSPTPGSANLKRVLVVLGGTDSHNATARVIELLAGVDLDLAVTVIARRASQDTVRRVAEKSPHNVKVIDFADNLPALAVAHDLVISAAGTSVWDFACAGVPMALVCVTENQQLGYQAAIDAGLAAGLGEPDAPGWADTAGIIEKLLLSPDSLQALSDQGMRTVDGLGAWRIVSAWKQLLTPRATTTTVLHARPAMPSDARMLLDWRNDPTTRAMSRSSEEVDWDGHVAWLSRVLGDPERQLFVIENADGAVGTVRWDHHVGIEWEVSISLAPSSRGRGLSYAVLSAGEQALVTPDPVRLLASVHESNTPSQRLFLRAGYTPFLSADTSGFATYEKLRLSKEPGATATTPSSA